MMIPNEEKVSEILQLRDTVIAGNYCIGCGACAAIKGSPFKIEMDDYGNYVAQLGTTFQSNNQIELLRVCPFSGRSKNEDQLGDIFFPDNEKDNYIGNYLRCFAGYVAEDNYRVKGSSGGFGKWLGSVLLKENKIDYFVQVVGNSTSRSDVPLFDYQFISSAEEVINGSKSSYYPTTLASVIKKIEETNGRFAITGVPCFIKTLRLLSLQNELLASRICYTIGIVCGGMKSANQSKMIGWQLGVHPDNLIAIDFRRKSEDKPASKKYYQVWSNKDSIERFEIDSRILGTNYGAGYFKPNACDYCDDVVGETADVSLGDAWLPQYVKDPKGTSIVIVRNKELLQIIEKYIEQQVLCLDVIDRDSIVKSQEGGFRHRREALSYRLAKKERRGEWYPTKRVNANQFAISSKRIKIYSLREKIAKESHIVFLNALRSNDFNLFVRGMKPLDRKYLRANYGSIFNRGLKRIGKIMKSLISVSR